MDSYILWSMGMPCGGTGQGMPPAIVNPSVIPSETNILHINIFKLDPKTSDEFKVRECDD
jgi:hypothetical protein